MATTYTWVVKNLNADQRGYAQSIYLEMQGTDGVNTVTESAISIFGGSDYKPMNQWSQTDVDNFALNQQYILEQNIDTQLAVLEAK